MNSSDTSTRRSRAGGNPIFSIISRLPWTPAFAGVTKYSQPRKRELRLFRHLAAALVARVRGRDDTFTGSEPDPAAPDPATAAARTRLEGVVAGLGRVAVAVSGGVDSMLLAHVCHRVLGARAAVYHAVSPAVPPEATARVRGHAARHGWGLHVIDAGEFADPRYLANPVDRCFFCKANLYGAIAAATDAQIVSGANLDDLGDFRPGLKAAADHGVRHPLVEAAIDKATVRRLAAAAGLDDLADLPASPCLSSRLVTGMPVSRDRLGLVLEVERLLNARLDRAATVRCRLRPDGLEVQLDDRTLGALGEGARGALAAEIGERCRRLGVEGPIRFAPYVRGSAFIGKRADAV